MIESAEEVMIKAGRTEHNFGNAMASASCVPPSVIRTGLVGGLPLPMNKTLGHGLFDLMGKVIRLFVPDNIGKRYHACCAKRL